MAMQVFYKIVKNTEIKTEPRLGLWPLSPPGNVRQLWWCSKAAALSLCQCWLYTTWLTAASNHVLDKANT